MSQAYASDRSYQAKCRYCHEWILQGQFISWIRRGRATKQDPNGIPRDDWYWHTACEETAMRSNTYVPPTRLDDPRRRNNNPIPVVNRPPEPPSVPTPKPTEPEPTQTNGTEQLLNTIIDGVIGKVREEYDPKHETINERIRDVNERSRVNTNAIAGLQESLAAVEKQLKASAPIIIQVSMANGVVKTTNIGRQHKHFRFMLKVVESIKSPAARNFMLSGPTGSGKTYAIQHGVSEALGLPFYAHGVMLFATELLGFTDGNGHYHTTEFRQAFEHGGVVVIDEFDGCGAEIGMAIMQATSAGFAIFGDGKKVYRHENCFIFLTANTWGFGGDDDYIGRNKMDLASLKRFRNIPWPYDEEFELDITQHHAFTYTMIECRKLAHDNEARISFAMRDSVIGVEMIESGMSARDVVATLFRPYFEVDGWQVVARPMLAWAADFDTENSRESLLSDE